MFYYKRNIRKKIIHSCLKSKYYNNTIHNNKINRIGNVYNVNKKLDITMSAFAV